ncbi:MAG TPA: hypothetical protein VGH62_13315 [Bradyrhizobium sp.]
MKLLNKEHGGTMTTQSIQNARYPTPSNPSECKIFFWYRHSALWTALLGLTAVPVFRLLMGG